MNVEEFLDRFEDRSPAGAGWVVRCPAHEDRDASLSVGEGEDGRVILKCHTGCKAADVVKAMGLTISDLFPAKSATQAYSDPEAIYVYRDEHGEELYQSLRMPGKKFMQRHYDPASPDAKEDGWVWRLDGVRRVLYRLPELMTGIANGQGVWIAEGEKDVDALVAAGKVATCNPGGAGPGKFRAEFAGIFSGAAVTIIADKDEPGRAHANRVRDLLTQHGATVRILQAKVGKDASDHLDAGLTCDQFVAVRESPRRGIVTAQQLAEEATEALDKSELDLPGYEMIEGLPVIMRPGRTYVLGAYTSDGKTTIAAQIARNMLSKYGIRVGYYTLEMPEADIRNKLLSHMGIPLRMLEEPWTIKQHPEILEKYERGVREMADWNLDVIFNTKTTADYMTQTSIEREHDFVIIDHIHRLAWGGERGKLESEIQKMTNLALEANIPLLMLCQVRKVSKGKDFSTYPKPTMQEFRETSVIGDDAAMAMSLWRQRDNSGLKFTGPTELTILKNRYRTGGHDESGRVYIPRFDPTSQLFTFHNTPIVSDEGEYFESEEEYEPAAEWGGLYD